MSPFPPRQATDLVKANEIMSKVIAKLTLDGLITPENQLSLGPKKFSGLMKLPGAKHYRRIDIRLSPWSSYYYCLLGGSGDALLQKLLRLTAKQRGLTLNEYGMGSSWTKADQVNISSCMTRGASARGTDENYSFDRIPMVSDPILVDSLRMRLLYSRF